VATGGLGRLRSVGSAVLVVVGLLLTPPAVAAAHARPQLTDTERFVAAFGPLAADRGVQDAVGDTAIAALDDAVDFSALADSAVSGLLDRASLPPVAGGLLQSLGGRAADALRALVDEQIRSVVASDAFGRIWQGMLRQAHSRALAGVRGESSASLVVRGDALVLQVGPVVERARQALVDRGAWYAAAIPQVDRAVELVEVPGLATVVRAHGAAAAAGVWLPVAAAALLVAGVLAARRRARAAAWTGLGLAGVTAVLLVVLAVVRATLAAPAHDEAAAALDRSRALLRVAAYDVAVRGVVRTSAILLVAGAIAAVAAHVVGRLAALPPGAPSAPSAPPSPAEPVA
jgi:hypothetical protein